jgi:predicted ATPase
VEWWGKAGDLAMRRSAYAEAIAHFEQAIRMADGLGKGSDQQRSRLRLQIAYGNALRLARGFGVTETQTAFAVALDLASDIEDMSERFPAYYGLWSASFLRGDLASTRDVAAAFLRDVESQPASPEAAIAHRVCGMTCWFEGNFVAARRHLEQVLAIYDAVRDRELVVRFGQDVASPAMVYLAMVLWSLGVLDRADSLHEGAVQHALRTMHVPTISYAHAHAAVFEMIRRDRERVAPHREALLGLAREHVIPLWIAFGTFQDGWVLPNAADGEPRIEKMHEGIKLLRLQLLGTFMPLFMTLLAETEAEAGRPDTGLAIVDEQLARIERTGQRWYLAELHRARGEMLLSCRPRDTTAAESAFTRAIDISRGQSAKLFELKAAMSLFRLWREQGKRAEAHDLLGPIYNWFTEGLDTPDLNDAKALLRSEGPTK